uniref:F-box/LRR-repeat protein 15-like leucin rich repeat domain-containing protein n=1 Tax=Leersia perrieri TaxID=77586 RepID=A0A0D9X9D4_9ORYZ
MSGGISWDPLPPVFTSTRFSNLSPLRGEENVKEASMEKKPRLVAGGGGGGGGDGEASGSAVCGGLLVERLPEALLVEVVGRLELEAACSAAASCRALRSAAAAAFSAVMSLDLSMFPPTNAILNRILAGNGALRSLVVNCSLIDDAAVAAIAKGSLRELSLLKCSSFSPYLFVVIGERCKNLRSFVLEMVASNDDEHFGICRKSVAHIFKGCGNLENLSLKFFPLLGPGSVDFESLVPIPSTIKVLLLQPVSNWQAKRLFPISTSLKTPVSSTVESLSLVLDIITDELVACITGSLHNLVELCLEDNPMLEPDLHNDLTNIGLQALGLCHKLTHLSLTRGKQNCSSTFRRVTDFGILMLAEGCKQLKTVRLAGFSKVRDAGYAALLQSCKDLKKFEVSTGCLSDLTCLDLDEAAPKITEVRLLNCGLLTSETAISLSSCTNLEVLDLSGCRSIADSGLVSISQLSKLTLLDLSGADVTDAGLSALGNGRCPMSSLCLRGCKRISNNGIASLLCGSGTINKTIISLDIGNVPRISGGAVTLIAKNCEQISSLCLRNCLLINDSSIETLGSMRHNSGRNSLRMLDLSYCSRLSRSFLGLFEPPCFRGLRWLGVGKNMLERRGCSPTVAELLERKPGLTVCGNACEMGCRNQCHPDIRRQ